MPRLFCDVGVVRFGDIVVICLHELDVNVIVSDRVGLGWEKLWLSLVAPCDVMGYATL